MSEIGGLAREGVAVMVATRDAASRPEMARAWGPAVDGSQITLSVEGAGDSTMAVNLAAGSPVTAVLSRIAKRQAVQIKGTVVDVRAPSPERLAAVADHVDRFVAELAAVGSPESVGRALAASVLLDVTIEILERYDETPGDETGRPL